LQDSTKIPDNQLRIGLQLIEAGKQCAEELKLQQKQNDLLYQRISMKDSIIYEYRDIQISLYKEIDAYKLSEENLQAQNKLKDVGIKSLQKSLSWQKTKTFFTSTAGLAGMAVLGYLLLKN